MNIFLCLLGPSLISLNIYKKLENKEFNKFEYIYNYFLFVFFNNFFASIVSILLFKASTSIDNALINLPVFAVKYIVISSIFSIILPFVIVSINKNIKYSIEVEKNDKKRKTNKKK